ncbi:hypothetical protein [Streptomyces sp. NPDC004296]|uniref:hypothetical protein n=1 Tax=Streptomyces sp. NPDC004296 TaxID=3364697 RepID=UPI00367B3B4A
MARSKHQTVNDYIAARKAGDADRASQIAREVGERFATRTTDGSEAAEIFNATLTVPFASKAN